MVKSFHGKIYQKNVLVCVFLGEPLGKSLCCNKKGQKQERLVSTIFYF